MGHHERAPFGLPRSALDPQVLSPAPDFSVSFTDDKGGPQENTMRNIRKKMGFLEQ